ncbi:uncharacterized protein LOC114756087 [Neltuma alba]|uniref:uncharacterized protein LOC114756087 n=1 Tax=Neltuma alba TaxID=207710 RepID=UPI0010A3E391|nr:uncharacterized protein LOC114756087 [Prosopis alba]
MIAPRQFKQFNKAVEACRITESSLNHHLMVKTTPRIDRGGQGGQGGTLSNMSKKRKRPWDSHKNKKAGKSPKGKECTKYGKNHGDRQCMAGQNRTFLVAWNEEGYTEYVAKYLTYQKVKIEHQKPARELQPLDILEWKWDSISMDFIVGLLMTVAKHDAIWVIIDRLTKSAYFLAMNVKDSPEKLARLYIKEVVRLHGVLSKLSERSILGPDIVVETSRQIKAIQQRLLTAQSR